MPHYLEPLLRPASIAVVGASQRAGTVGNEAVKNLLAGRYPGALFAVNPRYKEVAGTPCFPSLRALPQPVELVLLAVGHQRLAEALDEAIAQQARAGVIFSSLTLGDEGSPTLRQRIRQRAQQAGMLLCGANTMGFYNFSHGVRAGGFATRPHRQPGHVALISQSGSGMSGILDTDERIDFNFAVSTGDELMVTAEDYLDYALEQAETRVVGLFLETSRQPEKLLAALSKAHARRIPVVVVKVGRTRLAAQLARSHSGALAGNDAGYDAVFARYGAQRVADMDELATTLIMFAQPHAVGDGGLVTVHDSGGERQLLVDLADTLRVPLAGISEQTRAKLRPLLDPGLSAINPLDVWNIGGADFDARVSACFAAMLQDEDAALGAVVHDRGPGGQVYPEYLDYLQRGHAASGKPVFLVSNRQGAGADASVVTATRAGFPVLDGVSPFLTGAARLLAYRDFCAAPPSKAPTLPDTIRDKWRARLAGKAALSELEANRFLQDCGLPMVELFPVDDAPALAALAPTLSYPVALKTAQPGLRHKTDVDGVKLAIQNPTELLRAYRDMAARLGAAALVAPMLDSPGVEMILGITRDEQFGSLVVMGIGGIHAALLNDVVTLLPPFDAATAQRRLDRLKMRKLLDGVRGAPPLDVLACCEAAARLSAIAVEFGALIREVDINPLMALEQGCRGLDALVALE